MFLKQVNLVGFESIYKETNGVKWKDRWEQIGKRTEVKPRSMDLIS